MASDEIRRLIGGYATGTLSAAQRKLLFEAALDDQELFDELARDQALKDLLATPGVKQRLLASLQSLDGDAQPERVWWKHPLPWAMGTFALAVSVLLLAVVYFTPSGSRKVEVARNTVPSSSSTRQAQPVPPAPVAAESPAPPELPNEPKPNQPQARQRTGNGTAPPTPATPSVPGAAPLAPPLPNEPNGARRTATATTGAANRPATGTSPGQPVRDAAPASDKDAQVAENALKKSASGDSKALDAVGTVGTLAAPAREQRAAAPAAGLGGAPPPVAAPASPPLASAPALAGVPAEFSARAPTPAPVPRAAAQSAAAKLAPAGPLAFDYSIHDGVLRVVPATDGYMIVKASVGSAAAGEERLLLRTSHVTRTSPLVLSIPEGTASLLLVISSRPLSEDSVGDLAARSAPRTELAGTVSSTSGATPLAASARLEVRVRLR